MKRIFFVLFLICSYFSRSQSAEKCKVISPNLSSEYTGECKKGLASGNGEAKGVHRYVGEFKNGMPNGKGIYYYDNKIVYTGNMQDGIKEGKGEMLYKIIVKDSVVKDSIVKGYWSGDVFRGKQYKTYKFSGGGNISDYDISPSSNSGKVITFEISSTNGNPLLRGGIYVSNIMVSSSKDNNSYAKLLSTFESTNVAFTTIEVSDFPITLSGKLTNGTNFELEFYKAANWKIKFFFNK